MVATRREQAEIWRRHRLSVAMAMTQPRHPVLAPAPSKTLCLAYGIKRSSVLNKRVLPILRIRISPKSQSMQSARAWPQLEGIYQLVSAAPRRIDKHYKGYKAAEWEAWLKHYGIPLLDQHLGDEYVDNFRQLNKIYSLGCRCSNGQVKGCW